MRTFTLAPINKSLIDQMDAFRSLGPGQLTNPSPEPPAGLDAENATLYRYLVGVMGEIRGRVQVWQERALAEGRSAAQAVQSQSAP